MPLSRTGQSAGATDPIMGVLDKDFNSLTQKETSVLNSENIKQYQEIQKQMDLIETLLPDIKDVSVRAGLVG